MGISRRYGKGALLLCIIVILGMHAVAAPSNDDADNIDCINIFLDKALQYNPRTIEKASHRSEVVFGCRINRYNVDGDAMVMINDTPKLVIYYTKKAGEQSAVVEHPCDSSMKAFQLASSIFAYYSLPIDSNQYDIKRRNDESGTRDAWVISYAHFESSGFPYVFRHATVVICAITSKVCRVAYVYPVAPEPVGERTIPRGAAQEKAREWVDSISKSNMYYWKGWIDVSDINKIERKVLVVSDLPYRNSGIPIAEIGAYHCWAVPILRQEEGDISPYSGPAVFVRVDTGDVLGCS